MFGNLFSKSTVEDLLNELRSNNFNESKADKIIEHININAVDNDGKSLLHHMCVENRIEPIRWLIKKGIDKELHDYYDESAITLAVKNKSLESFELLLKLGFNADKQNRYGRTAVQDVILLNQPKYYSIIKKYSTNINSIDKKGKNILFDAVSTGSMELVEEVLQLDFDKNLLDKEGKPALFHLKVLDHLNLLKIMLSNGVDISTKDKNGNNLLFYVAKGNLENLDMFNYLIEKNINLNEINIHGDSILIELVKTIINLDKEFLDSLDKEKNIILMINKLIELKVDLNIKNNDGLSALMLAAKSNNYELVKALIENHADVNIEDDNKDTALSITAVCGNSYWEVIECLLVNGAKIDTKNNNNQTVIEKLIEIILHNDNNKKADVSLISEIDESCDYLSLLTKIFSKKSGASLGLNSKNEPYLFEPILLGNNSIVKLLLSTGMDINQVDSEGLNIIYKLMAEHKIFANDLEQKKYYATLKSLLDARVNVNAKDKFGGNTLHKAILDNDVQTVKMIINAHVDMDAKDKQGRNYIHNSVWKNKVQIMRVIHAKNSNLINTPDAYGVLPINYAAFLGYTDLVVELISIGSNINNTYPKKPYILEFLKKFHKNILPMIRNTKNSTDQRHVSELIKNMREEFDF